MSLDNTQPIDICFSKESNSGCKYIDGRCEEAKRNYISTFPVPVELLNDAAAMVAYAKEMKVVGKGSARTGIYEIQTFDGIHSRKGSQAKAVWTFKSLDQLCKEEMEQGAMERAYALGLN